MQIFLEIIENPGTDRIPEQIKIKVKDKKEALAKLEIEESAFAGLNYTKQIHYCNHSDAGENNQPCSIEPL